jgi:hypothetical protein
VRPLERWELTRDRGITRVVASGIFLIRSAPDLSDARALIAPAVSVAAFAPLAIRITRASVAITTRHAANLLKSIALAPFISAYA